MACAAQHLIGELLAGACRAHARVEGCKMHSAMEGRHHLRVLEFQSGSDTAVVAYMLLENEEGKTILPSPHAMKATLLRLLALGHKQGLTYCSYF